MQRYIDSLGPVVKIAPDEIHFETGAVIQLQEKAFDEADCQNPKVVEAFLDGLGFALDVRGVKFPHYETELIGKLFDPFIVATIITLSEHKDCRLKRLKDFKLTGYAAVENVVDIEEFTEEFEIEHAKEFDFNSQSALAAEWVVYRRDSLGFEFGAQALYFHGVLVALLHKRFRRSHWDFYWESADARRNIRSYIEKCLNINPDEKLNLIRNCPVMMMVDKNAPEN